MLPQVLQCGECVIKEHMVRGGGLPVLMFNIKNTEPA